MKHRPNHRGHREHGPARRRRFRSSLLVATAASLLVAAFAAGARADDTPTIPIDPVVCGPTDAVSNNVVECGGVEDVPSLDPAVTPDVAARAAAPAAADGPRVVPSGCLLHNEAVFYAPSDWFRLGQKLVAEVSPCSDFFISIPPLAADKVNFRSAQAVLMHTLGPQIQALAEVHLAGWQTWWRANGKTPFQAGVEARRRFGAFGYDGWALNEVPSSIRQGLPGTRAVLAEFLDGLYQGDGTLPPSRGVVFISGVAQPTAPLDLYKTNMRNWLADGLFWGAMQRTVRFWAQEVYGDARTWGVGPVSRDLRSDHTNDYLQHTIVLARAGGPADTAAHEFLERTFTPLGNAAWRWLSAFGYTAVTRDQMAMYVAEQTYAMRDFVRTYAYGLRNGRLGFAWAPRNVPTENPLPAAEFVVSTAAILERLGDGLRHAYGQRGGSPADACGPPGKRVWCDGAIDGATFYEGWKTFQVWP
jgi:hypothetical protein